MNIGSRQAGRQICENVLCCPAEQNAIHAAIAKALSPEFAAAAKAARSPYNGGDTAQKICTALKNALQSGLLRTVKSFYDGEVPSFTL